MTIPNDLVERFNSGDQQAFNYIYERFWGSMFTAALRFLNDADQAQEVTADVFLQIWKKPKNFESLDNIKAWLYTSTKNACSNIYNRNKRFKGYIKFFTYWFTTNHDPYQEFVTQQDEIKAEVFRQVQLKTETLPPQCRHIIKMSFYDGLKNEEIADQMDLSVQTVKNQKTRSLKILRKGLSDDGCLFTMMAIILFTLS